jgi:hypothetical protein
LGKTICVDFDGVIADYSKGWQGNGIFGDPVPGASKVLHKLRLAGWKIIIFTTRGEVDLLAKYFHKNSIPYDEINKNSDNPPGSNNGKPIADVYLDDRGVRFNGDWDEAYMLITTLEPWQ